VAEARAKPQKLEWTGGISESTKSNDVKKITLPNEKVNVAAPHSASAVGFKKPEKLKLKRETKGRSGHPVIVLFEITPTMPIASLEQFAKELKSKLGCGGTSENNTVILQTQNVERVEKELVKQGIVSVRAGGF
jgi:translation initiation factor 1 (eIF-1/SUI1)